MSNNTNHSDYYHTFLNHFYQTTFQVVAGHSAWHIPTTTNWSEVAVYLMKMPFGKHKGRSLDDVPDAYLLWVIDTCKNASPTLLQAIRTRLEIDAPESADKAKRKQHRDNQAVNAVVETMKAQLRQTQNQLCEAQRRNAEREAIVTKWFRKASFQFHPDRGGMHEVQVMINDLKDAFDSC